ncbi:hypothetical protein EB796_014196 [Bugula neritina]|uniref:Uncharacterized protein n=1 Tax=Bugula neritina TaxID=10212 RepID=A0A7J7JPY7_BUGNE|nr:hypothetical protein EB796_014196 [Bugula neritina]
MTCQVCLWFQCITIVECKLYINLYSIYIPGSIQSRLGPKRRRAADSGDEDDQLLLSSQCSLCLYLLLWKFLREKILWP